jgi:hypothetical protein
VITTGCNGAGELVTNGREGFVIPTPNHQRELIQALDGMADRASVQKMAVAACELGRAQTFDSHVSHLERIFEDISAEKQAARTNDQVLRPHLGGQDQNHKSRIQTPSTESERAPR